jgi:hypothetical protein
MSDEVKKFLPILRILSRASPYKRKKILQEADDNFIKIIIECCHNSLHGNVKFTRNKLEKLKKFKKIIRKIGKVTKNLKNRKKILKNRKKILIQSGGAFLPLILPAIISGLISLIKN